MFISYSFSAFTHISLWLVISPSFHQLSHLEHNRVSVWARGAIDRFFCYCCCIAFFIINSYYALRFDKEMVSVRVWVLLLANKYMAVSSAHSTFAINSNVKLHASSFVFFLLLCEQFSVVLLFHMFSLHVRSSLSVIVSCSFSVALGCFSNRDFFFRLFISFGCTFVFSAQPKYLLQRQLLFAKFLNSIRTNRPRSERNWSNDEYAFLTFSHYDAVLHYCRFII